MGHPAPGWGEARPQCRAREVSMERKPSNSSWLGAPAACAGCPRPRRPCSGSGCGARGWGRGFAVNSSSANGLSTLRRRRRGWWSKRMAAITRRDSAQMRAGIGSSGRSAGGSSGSRPRSSWASRGGARGALRRWEDVPRGLPRALAQGCQSASRASRRTASESSTVASGRPRAFVRSLLTSSARLCRHPPDRPHRALGGATPLDVYRRAPPANERQRIEPRSRYPAKGVCATPQSAARAGKRPRDLELMASGLHGAPASLLPTIMLREAA